eukprot:TRINITY_DN1619_c0_g1_i1.p1 TRINITY_DN1619_c0_g1~~TRINITY_DN1619_c0_g1_i1.p1  ORF type:complete len:106 (+),score=8.04 TRINITY_DN1619_c0_g1_i1:37-354(+)
MTNGWIVSLLRLEETSSNSQNGSNTNGDASSGATVRAFSGVASIGITVRAASIGVAASSGTVAFADSSHVSLSVGETGCCGINAFGSGISVASNGKGNKSDKNYS